MNSKKMDVNISFEVLTSEVYESKWVAKIKQDDLIVPVYGTFNSEAEAISVSVTVYSRYLRIGMYKQLKQESLIVI